MQKDNCSEIASALLSCWPEPVLAAARRIGVTKLTLDNYLEGAAPLPGGSQARLTRYLGLEFDDSEVLHDDNGPVRSRAHHVLFAGNEIARVLKAYDFLSSRGGAPSSAELHPAEGEPEHRWRYLLIDSPSGIPSLLCFPRIGKAAGLLDGFRLPGFHGRYVVDRRFYEAVASLRAEVEQAPRRALVAMGELCARFPHEIDRVNADLRNNATY